MKKLLTLLLLSYSVFIFAQAEKTDVEYFKNTETKITSLKFSTTSVKELESIDWKEVKSVFETNKEEEVIKMIFKIDLKDSKTKFNGSFIVSGKTKDIDGLTIKADKMLKGLIKISKKYENE